MLKDFPTCSKKDCEDYNKRMQCYSDKRLTEQSCIYYKTREDVLDVMAHGIRNESQLNLVRKCGL